MAGTKLCKYCKEEIDAKASKCPHCHEKQPGGCARVLVVIIVVIVLLIAIPTCIVKMTGGSTSASNKTSSQTESSPKYYWVFQEKTDDFDGKTSKYCSVRSEDSIKAVISTTRPYLLIRRMGKNDLDVIIKAEGVAFGNFGDSDKVRLKFDDEAPFSVKYDEAANGDPGMIFLHSKTKILEKLKTAKVLVIEFPVIMESAQRASFRVEGYAEVCKI